MAKFTIQVQDVGDSTDIRLHTDGFSFDESGRIHLPSTRAEHVFALLNQMFAENHNGRQLMTDAPGEASDDSDDSYNS